MLIQAIKWMLIGYGSEGNNPQYDLYNMVGNNVYPDVVPQNVGLPAVAYRVEKTNPDKVKELRALDNRVFIEIDVKDKSYAVVNQISTLIINQLHRYNNSYNSNDDDSIGYGTTEGSNKYGRFAPASTGDTQYIGGLQIKYLGFDNSIETYDKKLEVYNNTLLFKMMFVDDLTIWGSDVVLKFNDLNLMATSIDPADDPLYTQPIALDQGVNYLFTPSVLAVNNSNISSDTLDGLYENFYDPSGTSNTNRPTLKQSADNPPKYNSNNYLEFDTSEYLLSSQASDRVLRKYKEMTFFTVIDLPNSDTVASETSVLFKKSTTTDPVCGIYFYTEVIAGGIVKFNIVGTAFEDDGSGGEDTRGFTFLAGLVKWPMFGINTTYSWEDPFYFAVNYKRREGDNTYLEGQYETIVSSNFSMYGDTDNYTDWADTSTTSFKEYNFNFETIHSDITSFDTRGAGTIDANAPINIYDFVLWTESITFGSNKYNQIKRAITEKHNMYKRTSN